jgi:hypothetical protein
MKRFYFAIIAIIVVTCGVQAADIVTTNLKATNSTITNLTAVNGKFSNISSPVGKYHGTHTGTFSGTVTGNVTGNLTGIVNGNRINANLFANLSTALNHSSTVGKTLVISDTQVANNITKPSNRDIEVIYGGIISGQIYALRESRPEWFATTNTAAAFTAAVNALAPGGSLLLSNSTYRTAYGTYAAPMTKGNIKIKGTKMPSFNSGYTGLENGTIIQGGFIIKADYVEVTDLGVDSGSAVCTALYSGVAQEGFAWFDTDNVAGGNPWKNPVAHNISAICKNSTSTVHAVAFEHIDGGDISNIHTAYGVHGIVFKATNTNATQLYALSAGWEGLIIKSDDYAPCAFLNISNVFLGSIPGHDHDGAGLQINPNELQPLTNINLTNINIFSTLYGFKFAPATGSDMAIDINVSNLNVSNTLDYGVDIPATGVLKRIHFVNGVANANAKTGWNILNGGTGVLIENSSATQNTGSGFYAGTGVDAKLVNVTADDNTVYGFESASVVATLDGYSGTGNASGTTDFNWLSSANVRSRIIMVAPTFLNSWVNYGSPRTTTGFAYAAGAIHIKGTIKDGTINLPIFTLPSGVRPSEDFVFVVPTSTGFGTVEVRTDGNVVLTSGGTGYVILDGIRVNQ